MAKTLVVLFAMLAASQATADLKQFDVAGVVINNSENRLDLASAHCSALADQDIEEIPLAGPKGVGVGGENGNIAEALNDLTNGDLGSEHFSITSMPEGIKAFVVNVSYQNNEGGTAVELTDIGVITRQGLATDVIKSSNPKVVLQQAQNQSYLVCLGDDQDAQIIGVVATATGVEGSRPDVSIIGIKTVE